MSDETTKTFVELSYPGTLFAEQDAIVVTRRDPAAIAAKYPRAFSLQFFDLTSRNVTVDGVQRTVSGERKKLSPIYFPNGRIKTVAQLRKAKGDYHILISNMECNGWPKVVLTRCGNYQPFTTNCMILPTKGAE